MLFLNSEDTKAGRRLVKGEIILSIFCSVHEGAFLV